jgi:hypothetical protein
VTGFPYIVHLKCIYSYAVSLLACNFDLQSELNLRVASKERTPRQTKADCEGEVVPSSFTCFKTARLVSGENGTINIVLAA